MRLFNTLVSMKNKVYGNMKLRLVSLIGMTKHISDTIFLKKAVANICQRKTRPTFVVGNLMLRLCVHVHVAQISSRL